MQRIFFILVNLGVMAFAAQAQILQPVKWSYAAKKAGAGAVVMLRATIEPGWHIYSARQADGGPVKTSFTFNRSNDYQLEGKISEPQPLTKYEKAFDMQVSYFEGSVTFQQKIKLNKASAAVRGELEFMVCNDQKCLPPEVLSFNIPVK